MLYEVITVDEYGEHDSVTAAVFTPEGCRVVKRIAYPHSLGVFYAACTEYLGFVPNGDEWKVMGAAAYGSPARFRPALGQILEWRSELGEWRLDVITSYSIHYTKLYEEDPVVLQLSPELPIFDCRWGASEKEVVRHCSWWLCGAPGVAGEDGKD